MSDVRLTATNPVDSTVVPVACNEKGELLTVPPVIQQIDNDVTINGNLTVDDGQAYFSGNVGIGTSSPPHNLSVESGGRLWNVSDDGVTNYVTTSATNTQGDTTFHRQVANRFHFGTEADGTNDLMFVGNNGNVGIGTNDPQSNLHIAGDGGAALIFQDSSGSDGVNSALIEADGTSALKIQASGGLTSKAITFFRSSNSEVMRIASTGNVGVGTDTPRSKLDVNGDVIVESRNKSWMLVEQGGLCHMVEQSASLDTGFEVQYLNLRDVFAEIDSIKLALQEVMEKLRLDPPDGWPVWDGSNETA
jgi:hypothetical protein